MTNIIKKEKGTQPGNFGSVVDQIFQNNLSRFFDDSFWGFDGTSNRHQVPVNIRETDKSYELEFIAPGLKKQDFQLNVAGDTLSVSFENKQENKEENNNEGWIKQEYKMQSFTRSFNLDSSVDAAKIAARYDDGVLYLNLPKKESAQKVTRTINIQ